jgi:hypothetical protein
MTRMAFPSRLILPDDEGVVVRALERVARSAALTLGCDRIHAAINAAGLHVDRAVTVPADDTEGFAHGWSRRPTRPQAGAVRNGVSVIVRASGG